MDKEMIMASERFGNIEDLSYKDDISLFSQIGEYSQMQPFKLDVFVLLVCLNGHGSLNINGWTIVSMPARCLCASLT